MSMSQQSAPTGGSGAGTLAETLDRVDKCAEQFGEAWASWRSAAGSNASLAAVMGTCIPATLMPTNGWKIFPSHWSMMARWIAT